MTPTLSNLSLPDTKTLTLSHPFGGVYRRNLLPSAQGQLQYLHRCSLKDGAIQCLPAYETTTYARSKRAWASEEYTRGVINDPQGDDFWTVTEASIDRHTLATNPINYLGTLGTADYTSTGPPGSMTFSGSPALLSSGIMYGAKIKIADDSTYYTCDGLNSDTVLRTVEALPSFTGKTVEAWNMGFAGSIASRYGPRYCWFGDTLIILSSWGVCSYPFGASYYTGAIALRYRGMDVIPFAGRPVVLGAIDTYPANYSPSIAGRSSDMLVWPTRGDYTDWSSYGSGYLYLHDDGAGILAGCNWGEEAYLFTCSRIYRMIETGTSASNPIATKPHPAKLDAVPISNVARGNKGMYFWTTMGPRVFDGNEVYDISQGLETDLGSQESDPYTYGVHAWADDYNRAIRFNRYDLEDARMQYIFWEDSQQWTTLDEDAMYLAGTGRVATGEWGIPSTEITTSTVIERLQDETSATALYDLGGNALTGWVSWRGICMEEGPLVNKVLKHVRVLVDSYFANDIKLVMREDTATDSLITNNWETKTLNGGEIFEEVVFTPSIVYPYEAAVFRLDILIGPRTRIYQVMIDYAVAGDTEI